MLSDLGNLSKKGMLTVRVRSINSEAEGIRSFVLEEPNGDQLPTVEAGAHIDVQAPGGLERQYSLCHPPESGHYQIAVLNVPGGRGGSASMHKRVRSGDFLQISKPRNQFPLARDARHSILIAGGIGITPILSMMEALKRQQASFEMHYCTRSPAHTAFRERIEPFVAAGQAWLHHDGGDAGQHLDFGELLRAYRDGTHLYFCGPGGFMKAVRQASEHWPREAVHWESFAAPQDRPSFNAGAPGFRILLQKSGKVVRVSPEESILQAVRKAGVDWESSCEAGVCGTCRVRYLGGRPEHNDCVLSDDERREFMLICCSRAADDSLILDM